MPIPNYPSPPFKPQQQSFPGLTDKMDPKPDHGEDSYVGHGLLQGKRTLITGGDSGIGAAVAIAYAREGADVAIAYLPSEQHDAERIGQLLETAGVRVLLQPCDISDRAQAQALIETVTGTFGGLDVLVNNAAFQLHCHALEDLSDEHLQETLQTNIAGYFHMARAALPHLKRGAAIINSGSETGLFGSKSLLDYSATKGAIHAFTMALASQLQPRGIRVNAVAPGPVWTPLNPADKSAEDVAEFGKSSAMGRAAQPEELSPAYVFLASPITASYISGAILPVMGGPQG